MSTHAPYPRALLLTLGAGLLLAAAACQPTSPQPQVTLPSAPPVVVVSDASPPPADDTVPVQAGALDEIRARLPFTIKTPAWVPEGYRLSDEISVAGDAAWVLLEWEHETGALVDLVISPYAPATPNAPPQFVKAVVVAGRPAQFIFGLHNSAAGQWDPTLQTILTWQDGDLYYSLATAGTATSAKDLKHMAQSMT